MAGAKKAGYQAIMIMFGELWLKGRNRNTFVKTLYSNINHVLENEQFDSVEQLRDRFVLRLNRKSDVQSIQNRLRHVFGISWFSTAVTADNSIDKIIDTASKLIGNTQVRIVAHRSYKGTAFNSVDLVKAFIDRSKNKKLRLDKDADNEIYITITNEFTLICDNKIMGLGGLPVGSSGRALVLLSGGIDSPVAAFYAMKRGLQPVYLHFHAFSDNQQAAESKISELMGILTQYARSKIYYIPSHMFQAAVMKLNGRYEMILFKRFMYDVASLIAQQENASVIVTGESLGQVASQTVYNLIASEAGTSLFIMRPLIGMDKQEIIAYAEKLGSYQLSIKPYKDVCSINARNPVTNAKTQMVDKLYAQARLDQVAKQTVLKIGTVSY